MVTLNGWGHTTLGQSRCTDDRVADYLLHPRQKRRDAVCATEIKPFVTQGAEQAARAAVVAATHNR